ncbi:TetR/AcrR family transcriptional regulator [Metabacillus sp. 84]|uniref:TetR/AcrR family transcriptional regulator n=1 Tax=unclassified Metabacillus TaxID=2675274 RepID=UPI003CF3C92A
MPKYVDHDKQKEIIAEAVWRIIAREGMEQVSVRKAAEEAGVSPGSLRHYFSSQSELFIFSMKSVSDRVRKRVQNAPFTGVPLDDMEMVLEEILPLTDETRTETEVWFTFIARAFTDAALSDVSHEVYDQTRAGIALIIQGLIKLKIAREDLDEELETERLFALIDGLAIHGVIRPAHCTPEMMIKTVRLHLHSLCR